MATVIVITVGIGDTYRIERIYLDRDQADRFAQDYNGIAPVEHGRPVPRRGPTTVRTGGRSGGRGCR